MKNKKPHWMINNKYHFCLSCSKAIKKQQLPKFCKYNNLDFGEIPSCFNDLSILDKRLIAMRTPFMKIMKNRINSNYKIEGSCINFPY
jgi:hypothetical protein